MSCCAKLIYDSNLNPNKIALQSIIHIHRLNPRLAAPFGL